MSRPVTATDAALQTQIRELAIPNARPYGHGVPHLVGRDFAIISEGNGHLGYFKTADEAQPWLRMLVRDSLRGRRRLDFALFFWGPDANGWTLHQRTVPMHEVPVDKVA